MSGEKYKYLEKLAILEEVSNGPSVVTDSQKPDTGHDVVVEQV